MIPEPASVSFLCGPNIVGWKIHVRNVRCLLDMYVEWLYLVEIWLRGSAY